MDIYLFLIIVHIVGTIIGVGGATMIEVTLNKALEDGTVSEDEQGILKPTYTVVRVGLALALFSGFGFLLLYKFWGDVASLYNPVLWAKTLIIAMIGVNTLLLQAKKIGLYWGSAISFASWWMAAILGIFLTNNVGYPFWGIIASYVVVTVIAAYLLHFIRGLIHKDTA